jgi:hypothetical protein
MLLTSGGLGTFAAVAQQHLLFNSGDLRLSLEADGQALVREVEQAPEEHLLKVDEDEWVRALVERYTVQAPVLLADQAWMDPLTEVKVDVSWDIRTRFIRDPSTPTYVSGYRTVAHIPFTGERNVFLLQPSTHTYRGIHAHVAESELRLRIEYPHDRPADIKGQTQELVERVEQYLGWARGDIEQFNGKLEATARQAISSRRERLQRNYEHVAATGLPIGPQGQTSKTYVADVIVRRPAPLLPTLSAQQPMPLEPVLADEVFEHILRVIRDTGLGMERSPNTYAGMGEEDRRQLLLSLGPPLFGGESSAAEI